MKRVLSFLLCALMLTALCVPTFAADAPTIDTSRKASLTIYKYDMTTAAAPRRLWIALSTTPMRYYRWTDLYAGASWPHQRSKGRC